MVAACVFQSFDNKHDNDLVMGNQEFITLASSSNIFEIEADGLAILKGQNERVKTFGQKMVTLHTNAGMELRALADEKGWIIAEVSSKEKKNIDKLGSESVTEFDKEFSSIMVHSHQEAVNFFEIASNSRGVPNDTHHNWTSSTLPVLKMH